MSKIRGYFLTKVIDRQWAERLLDGELYMRPISAFVDQHLEDPHRGDLFEATLAVGNNVPIVLLPEGGPAQYNIYCLYCFEYSDEDSCFVAPDPRWREVGDTAVLIVNPIEFFARLRRCFSARSITLSSCAANRVRYRMDALTPGVYDEFDKGPSYSWQNEYRLSIDMSKGLDRKAWQTFTDFAKIMFLRRGGQIDLASFGIVSAPDHAAWEAIDDAVSLMRFLDQRSKLESETTDRAALIRPPLVLQLGSLRDICISISTIDLLARKLPVDERLHKPYVLPPLYRQV